MESAEKGVLCECGMRTQRLGLHKPSRLHQTLTDSIPYYDNPDWLPFFVRNAHHYKQKGCNVVQVGFRQAGGYKPRKLKSSGSSLFSAYWIHVDSIGKVLHEDALFALRAKERLMKAPTLEAKVRELLDLW